MVAADLAQDRSPETAVIPTAREGHAVVFGALGQRAGNRMAAEEASQIGEGGARYKQPKFIFRL